MHFVFHFHYFDSSLSVVLFIISKASLITLERVTLLIIHSFSASLFLLFLNSSSSSDSFYFLQQKIFTIFSVFNRQICCFSNNFEMILIFFFLPKSFLISLPYHFPFYLSFVVFPFYFLLPYPISFISFYS